jgi:hypothetical protein
MFTLGIFLVSEGYFRNVKVPSSPYKRGRKGTCKGIHNFWGLSSLWGDSVSYCVITVLERAYCSFFRIRGFYPDFRIPQTVRWEKIIQFGRNALQIAIFWYFIVLPPYPLPKTLMGYMILIDYVRSSGEDWGLLYTLQGQCKWYEVVFLFPPLAILIVDLKNERADSRRYVEGW